MNCLNQAIADERIHQVRLLLTLNVDSETRDKKDLNRTPLLKAVQLDCEDSSHKILKILLKAGVNINAVDNDKRSALHYACKNGKCHLVDVLLKEDSIELNERDKDGKTPLMHAAANGHFRAARTIALRLIKFDLDIDLRDDNGYTALLLAIKNQNYNIAHDLIRYGNACSGIRDNEEFKNAPEWLKKNLDDRRMIFSTHMKQRIAKKGSVVPETEVPTSEEIEYSPSRMTSGVPLVTLTTLPDSTDQETEASVTDISLSGMVASMKEAAAKSGLLFEPDPYRKHSRPPSSVISKASLSSQNSANQFPVLSNQAPEHLEKLTSTRPSTGIDNASVLSSQVSQVSKLGDDVTPSQRKSAILSASSTSNTKRFLRSARTGKGKLASARKLADSKLKAELGNINVPVSDYQYPIRPESKTSAVPTKGIPPKDVSRNNIAAIQALKQALKDQRKGRISRSRTTLTRPYTAMTAETWKEKTEVNVPVRPHTRAQGAEHEPGKQIRKEASSSAQLFDSHSIMSVNTLMTQSNISEENFTNNYRQPSSIERSRRNIQTLFSLYTDSYLWSPAPTKPASLSVQVVDNGSDKLTLASDLTASASDLASIVDRSSFAPSEDASHRHSDARVATARSRLVSNSATSRASRRSTGTKGSRNGSAFLSVR